jgi:hypothetical protein
MRQAQPSSSMKKSIAGIGLPEIFRILRGMTPAGERYSPQTITQENKVIVNGS